MTGADPAEAHGTRIGAATATTRGARSVRFHRRGHVGLAGPADPWYQSRSLKSCPMIEGLGGAIAISRPDGSRTAMDANPGSLCQDLLQHVLQRRQVAGAGCRCRAR